MKIKIKNIELQEIISGEPVEFPKYSTQILNLANANAQGTRPAVVGQMSDLIQEFPGRTLEEWREWYKKRQPHAIKHAADKIYIMVNNLKSAINKIDKDLVEKWVEDLVIMKTFIGLRFQEAILKKVADEKGKKYRLAAPTEESKGIDGYIGSIPVSIKPVTYRLKKSLGEKIEAEFIYYEKKKDGIIIEYDF